MLMSPWYFPLAMMPAWAFSFGDCQQPQVVVLHSSSNGEAGCLKNYDSARFFFLLSHIFDEEEQSHESGRWVRLHPRCSFLQQAR
jgi:hypothetical protein